MKAETEIIVTIRVKWRAEKYVLRRLFDGLIPPYSHLVPDPDREHLVIRIDEDSNGALHLGPEGHLLPRANLFYTADSWTRLDADHMANLMESDGWKILEKPEKR